MAFPEGPKQVSLGSEKSLTGSFFKEHQIKHLGIITALLALSSAYMTSLSGCLGIGGSEDGPAGYDTLRAATVNMTIGFSVAQLLMVDFDNDSAVEAEGRKMFNAYLGNMPRERVALMAEEIINQHLDVVGLQEVMAMKVADTLHVDFLILLINCIEERSGIRYHSVRDTLNHTMVGPYPSSGDNGPLHLEFFEGNALLVHPDYELENGRSFPYGLNITLTQRGEEVESERTAVFAQVISPKGQRYQFFTTHLEIGFPFPLYQEAQLSQLLGIADSLNSRGMHQVLLGDFNTPAEGDLYNRIISAEWSDAQQGAGLEAGTCCLSGEDMTDPEAAFGDSRIDFVFARPDLVGSEAEVSLDTWKVTPQGDTLWAIDHKMLTTELRFSF